MANSINKLVIINSNNRIRAVANNARVIMEDEEEITIIILSKLRPHLIIGIIKIGTIKTKIRGNVATEIPTIINLKNSPNNNSSSNTSSSSSRKAMDDIITKETTTDNRDSSSSQRCQFTLRRAALKLLTLVTTLT